MGQKIHPLGFRLHTTQKCRSNWFASANNYSQLVIEDQFLRQFFFERFRNAGITTINITRKANLIKIKINVGSDEAIVGTHNKRLDSLKKELIDKIKSHRSKRHSIAVSSNNPIYYKKENRTRIFLSKRLKVKLKACSMLCIDTQLVQLSIFVNKLSHPFLQASYLTQILIKQLEKRVLFRKALNRTKRLLISKSRKKLLVKGLKIQISGRLNGAEIARTEWTRKGRLPLHTLQANIDYSSQSAKTIYGLLGIKIWLYK